MKLNCFPIWCVIIMVFEILTLFYLVLVSFAAVIKVVTQRSSPLSGEERCVTTLITAAKETSLVLQHAFVNRSNYFIDKITPCS